jgi:hypothetical protein
MRRSICGAVAALWLLTAPASTRAQLPTGPLPTGDAAVWMTSIHSRMPAPAGPAPTVIFGACPGLAEASACLDGGTIYIETRNPFDIEHELGHLFDARNLDPMERRFLRPMLGGGKWSDCGDVTDMAYYGHCPKETFADAYAACALALHPPRITAQGRFLLGNWETSYDWWNPGPKRNAEMCGTIRAFADPN